MSTDFPGPVDLSAVDGLLERAASRRVTDPSGAWQAAERAQVLATRARDDRRLALARLHLASAASRLSRNAEAAVTFAVAIQGLEAHGLHDEAALARMRLGKVLMELGQYEEAQPLLTSASNVGVPPPVRADAFNQLGTLHLELGRPREALEAFTQSLDVCVDTGDEEGRAIVVGNMALVWGSVGDDEQAVAYYQEALAVYDALGDHYNAAVSLGNLAETHERLGRFEEAAACLERALLQAQGAQNPSVEASLLAGQLRTFVRQGRFEDARALLAAGLPVTQKADPRSHAWWQLGAALLHHHGGENQAALAAETAAVAGLTALDVRPELSWAHALLAQAHEARGRYEAAYRHLRRHADLDQAQRGEQVRGRVQLSLLRVEAQQARRDAEVQRARAEHLARLSAEDGLTGVLNRRALDERLTQLLNTRPVRPTGVLLLDLDHFKAINDRHGHAVGDEVLKRFARLLQDHLQAGQMAARYGGEEFAVVLPDAAAPQVLAWGERLRRACRALDWQEVAPGLAITFSGGVGVAMSGAASAVLGAADAQLYRAKQQGRDRLCG